MMEILGALRNSRSFLRILQDNSGRTSIMGVPIDTLGADRNKIKDKTYDLTPELYKVLSSTSYTS